MLGVLDISEWVLFMSDARSPAPTRTRPGPFSRVNKGTDTGTPANVARSSKHPVDGADTEFAPDHFKDLWR